tara:strand:- start:307 stop:735 length:429 start_codon:yes stop_codon:yes gene_type:complete
MNIVYLKLVNGENLISYVETIDDEYVHVCKPLQIHTINTEEGALIRTTKWIPFTKESDFPIKVNNILLIATPTEGIVKYYLRSLDVLDDGEEDYLLEEKEDHYDADIGAWDEVFYKEDEEGWDEETVHAFNELAANNQIKVH